MHSPLLLLLLLLLLLSSLLLLAPPTTALHVERSSVRTDFFSGRKKAAVDPVVQRAEDLAKLQEFIHVDFACAGMPSDYSVRARDVIEMMCPNYRLVWKVRSDVSFRRLACLFACLFACLNA